VAGDPGAPGWRSDGPPPGVASPVALNPQGISRVLGVILGSIVVAALAAVLLGAATGQMRHVTVGTAVAAIHAGLFALARQRGHEERVAASAAVVLLVTVVYLTWVGNGLHDIAVVLFQLPVVIASLLLGRRGAVAIVGGVVAGVVAVGVGEVTGHVESPTRHLTSYDDIIGISVVFVASAVMMRAVVQAMHQGFLAARDKERSYREVFDATSEAIFIQDVSNGRILDVNRTATHMFGYSREEMLGMTVHDLAARDGLEADNEDPLAPLRDAVERERVIFEWRARARDGRLFWVESALRSTEIGGSGCVLAAVRDVDDRRRLEENLTQAEKLQAVGQLAGGVAHDFNNQLTGIIAGAELLRRRLDGDATATEYLDIILQASRRSADLVGNLLAFARKAKRQEVEVDVCAVVEEVVGLLRRSIDRRIIVEAELPADRILVKGDPTLLSNALLNLGLNARDAMPAGGLLTFEIDELTDEAREPYLDEVLDADRLARIRVRDTGHGMDEPTAQRMFEPFFTTKESGTGMGLSAVYGTMKSHGGTVRVETAPGEGTTFELIFPEPVRTAGGTRAVSPMTSAPVLDLCVLVADDEPAVATATRAMLTALGCRVILATNGQEAVQVFREHPEIDVVLLDRMMPIKTGDAALREIRALDPNARAVLASGYAEEPVVPGAGGPPVVTLRKPFLLGDLEQALRRTVGTPA
jgi:PAS domain S-box-containing protein